MLAQNELGKKIEELLDALCDTEASIEAALDYPEEELEGTTVAEQTIEISRAKRTIDALVKTVRLGGLVKNGAYVAIVGADQRREKQSFERHRGRGTRPSYPTLTVLRAIRWKFPLFTRT